MLYVYTLVAFSANGNNYTVGGWAEFRLISSVITTGRAVLCGVIIFFFNETHSLFSRLVLEILLFLRDPQFRFCKPVLMLVCIFI